MTEQEELEQLKQNSPYALPDDPSTSGWSTAKIKEKFYAGLILLYTYFKESRTNQNNHLDSMQEIIDQINQEYQDIINNNTLRVKYDFDGNEIVNTYAKLVDIASGNIAAVKYLKQDGTTKQYIYQLENDLITLTTNYNLLKEWSDNLKSLTSQEAVQRANSAETAVKATQDALGNVISTTYATVTSITQILNGIVTVGKAAKDQNGNVIDTTYATKAENALKVAIADIVNNLTTTDTDKPLSAYQGKVLKDSIDAINTLLQSNDTDLDQLQEIVTYIKNNKNLIDGITTSKVNITDIIDNLTSEIAAKPLSAKQGYVLKGYIDAIHQTLLPQVDSTYDLGSASYKYKDVYVSGNLKDGTHSISIANMIQALADILTLQSASHTHANKALLDTYTQTEEDLADAVGKKHSHSNKNVLDSLTQAHLNNSHTHSNKTTLDGITANDITNWNDKYSRTETDAKVGNAIAVANGKTKSYVIDLTDNPSFNAVTDSITLADSTTLTCIDGTTVTLGDLKAGDVILITDTDVPDRWVAQISQSNETVAYRMDSLETRKVDLTPYYTKQEIDANKQDKIDNTHKLSSDLVDDTNKTNKFVNAAEKDFLNNEYNKTLNLFNINSMDSYHYIDANGGYTYDSNYSYEYASDIYIPVNSSKITFTFDTTYLQYSERFYRVGCYNDSKTHIQRLSGVPNETTLTLTLPTGTRYIRLGVNTPNRVSYNFMLNEGTTALPYQAYNGAIVHEKSITPVLLWENRNPNSAWSEGVNTITVPNMSNYKYIIVAYKNIYTSTQLIYKKVKYSVDESVNGSFCLSDIMTVSGQGGQYDMVTRALIITSPTTIDVGSGRFIHNGSCYVSNNYAIPIAIYGTNIL